MSESRTRGFPRSDEPLFTLVSQDNAAMRAAFAKTAATIPQFIKRLDAAGKSQCSAKLRFRDPDESTRLGEDRLVYLWLGAVHYHVEERMFSGTFFELPPEFEKWHHIGKRLGFDSEDIFDWMVLTEEGRLFGGFTIRVTRSLLPEAQRADYDAHVGIRVYEPEA